MGKTIILTFAITTLALSAIASRAAITYGASKKIILTACEKQIWPNFSDNCLLTIAGEKSERKFRIVSY